MPFRNAFAHPWLTACVSGLLLGFSVPPYPLPMLAYVALVPLLHVWAQAASRTRAFLLAYVAFQTTFAVAFFWPLLHPMPETVVASLGGLILVPSLMAIPFALAHPVRQRLGLRVGVVALVAFYLTMEAALSRGPLAFPWALLGHTQADALWINQMAEIAGVPGLTLWLLLVNVCVWQAWRASSVRRRSTFAALVLALVMLALAFSAWRRDHLPRADEQLAVGVVQPALPALAWADLNDTTRVALLLDLSDALLNSTPTPLDVLIWPETTLPPSYEGARLQAWVNQRGVPLLTGAIRAVPSGDGVFTNSALLFRSDTGLQVYDKRRLVPFAEHVPFSERLSWLRAFSVPAGGVRAYQPGPADAELLALGTTSVGVLICFESAFGSVARRYAEQGAGFLAVLTQDGWWGRSLGYRQHLALARLRAIETRRAVVQVAVTGTTALIQPDGASAFESGWMEPGAYVVRVPLSTATTPYLRGGDVVSLLAFIASMCIFGASVLLPILRTRRRAPAD